jgi:hypothetical protein
MGWRADESTDVTDVTELVSVPSVGSVDLFPVHERVVSPSWA